MERDTVEVYEGAASRYRDNRHPTLPHRAGALAAAVRSGGVRADLGCGPGLSLDSLGRPVVALDAAHAMVSLARDRSPHALAVQGDLETLPFRRHALAGAWVAKAYQHLRRDRLPMALAELHWALEVGAPVELVVFPGEGESRTDAGDDFPGRLFVHWQPDDLRRVLVGAGFERVDVSTEGHHLTASARRARSLPDTVAPEMRLLVCGLNPSVYAADVGVGFARPGNRFWPAALEAGIVSRPRDPVHALRAHGVGMTDLVKRATARADALSPAEYRDGVARLEHLVRWLRPGAVVMVGLSGWRMAVDGTADPGRQERRLGGAPVYVMPSTSGANAHARLADLVAHLRQAAALADQVAA